VLTLGATVVPDPGGGAPLSSPQQLALWIPSPQQLSPRLPPQGLWLPRLALLSGQNQQVGKCLRLPYMMTTRGGWKHTFNQGRLFKYRLHRDINLWWWRGFSCLRRAVFSIGRIACLPTIPRQVRGFSAP
jgi:hypothetical protein